MGGGNMANIVEPVLTAELIQALQEERIVTIATIDFEKGTDHLDGLVVKNPVEETKKAIKELEDKVDAEPPRMASILAIFPSNLVKISAVANEMSPNNNTGSPSS